MGSLEDEFTSPGPEEMAKICQSGNLGHAFLSNPIDPLFNIDEEVNVLFAAGEQKGIVTNRGNGTFGNVYRIRFADSTEHDTIERNIASVEEL